jgi:hypothetical protein
MSGGEVVIHFNGANELFDIDDFNVTTVDDLLKLMQYRIYGNNEKLILVSRDYLSEGPYLSEPLNDVRLREIIEMIQQRTTQDSINEKSEKGQRPVELWLCNCNKTIFICPNHLLIFCNFLLDTNNGFLFGNSSTTSKQHNSRDTIPVCNNDNSKQIHVQTHDPGKKFVFFFI